MSSRAKRGDWVQLYEIVLRPEERAHHIPEDTKKSPLEQWVKGYANCSADLGEEIEITTVTGRIVKGTLVEINPGYIHDFGECIPELLHIGPQLRKFLMEGSSHD